MANKVPVEILTEIFLLATDANRFSKGIGRHYIYLMVDTHSPLNLIHVCRLWRNVALSTKSLWAQIAADGHSYNGTMHWLAFSAPAPLHLAFSPPLILHDSRKTYLSFDAQAARPTLFSFHQHLHRWESLYLDLSENVDVSLDETVEAILRAAALRSPLKHLEMHTCPNSSLETVHEIIHAIFMFSFLRSFCWRFARRGALPVVLPRTIRWNTLETILVETTFSINDAMWCIAHCTSAKYITLLAIPITRTLEPMIQYLRPPTPVTLPKLESLTIRLYDAEPGNIMEHLTMPSLSSLELHPLTHLTIPKVNEFFNRSRCLLVKFVVDDVIKRMTDRDIYDCISMPYLLERSVPDVKVIPRIAPTERYGEILLLARERGLGCRPELWHEGGDDPETAWYNIGWRKEQDDSL